MSEFDAFSGHYDEDLDRLLSYVGADTLEFARRKADRLAALSLQYLGQPRERRILDIGCGTGNVVCFLQDRFLEAVGGDVAHSLLVEARAKAPRAQFVDLEETSWPFSDAEFDVAFCACVWHHVSDAMIPALCAQLHRVVRPGGLVVVFEHNPYNPITRKIVRECELDRDVERLIPMRQVCQVFRQAGLEIVDKRYTTFFPGKLRVLFPLEEWLGWLPLGGQYVVAGRKAR